MSLRFALIFVLLMAVAAPPARADIYSYRDENGVLTFTNIRPNDNRYKVRIAYKQPKRHYAAPGKKAASGGNMRPQVLSPQLETIVNNASQYYSVDKSLIQAVIHAESDFDAHAVSPKGASGLMQLMPKTARRYGVRDIFDPEQNIIGGVHYLSDLLESFGHNVRLALAAYNAGKEAVLRYGGVPPFPETLNYVNKVMQLNSRYNNI
jgi:soluble lytic murein transglycosylase-like protein